MDEDTPLSSALLRAGIRESDVQEVSSTLDSLGAASLDEKRAVLNSLERLVDHHTATLKPLLPVLTSLLETDERAIRLTTAKLLVSVAETDPQTVVSMVSSLADRLSDEEEFYYVRARSAEALGYIALEQPDEVTAPEVLADLRIGLSFDEPEVKQKLAKALEYVALGNPRRLRHQVSSLAEHLADEDELVRYHICTALVCIGTQSPDRLVEVTDALVERLDDECLYVRGRAAEGLGQLADEGVEGVTVPKPLVVELLKSDESFVEERARFAYSSLDGTTAIDETSTPVGTIESVRKTTADVADEIESPDIDGECPHCELSLPEDGPLMCPRCGGPY